VTIDGRPGVWFFSLDAANRLAVWAARRNFFLPYFFARMAVRHDDGWIDYQSTRVHRGAPQAQFSGRYRPIGPPQIAPPGSLDDWLTGRYCLYSANGRGRIFRGDIDHVPWPLEPAEAEIRSLQMSQQIGIALPDTPPLLHFARRLDVVAARLAIVNG
jgi:uncharacterized protein YqjF (DUF2071 family)